MPVIENIRYGKAGCSESCPSGLEGAGRKRTPARKQRAALPPYATLLLNAGAPILTVKLLLGHKRIETTLGYARLYDGTVAADYFRAMALVERQIALPEDQAALPPSHGELIALVDSLRTGTLNDRQQEVIWQLRAGLMSLAVQQGELVEVSP